MNNNKYIIVNNNTNLHAQWDGKTIIFESEDDAKTFIEIFPRLFDVEDYSIVPEPNPLYSIVHILYKDLIKDPSFIEELGITS